MNTDALIIKGNTFIQEKDYSKAVDIFQKILNEQPFHVGALNGLAVIAMHESRHADANLLLTQAIELDNSQAYLHYNQGLCLLALGENQSSIKSYQHALNLQPQYPEALQSCVQALYETITRVTDDIDAITTLKTLLNHDFCQSSSDIYYELGCHLRNNSPRRAEACFKQSIALNASHPYADKALEQLYQTQVPNWHIPMMNDAVRNAAYQKAIQETVTKQSTVLDIGTGSGLLSMMAARCEASHVYSCESVSLIADKAQSIIKTNGFTDSQITIINKLSTELTIPNDIPKPVDLIITETFGTGLIEENCLIAIEHAKKNLLEKQGKLLPERATLYIALLDSREIYELYHIKNTTEFDISSFNDLVPPPRSLWTGHLNHYQYTLLSKPTPCITFDFYQDNSGFIEQTTRIEITQTGEVNTLCMWFDLWLTPTIGLTTNPLPQTNTLAKSTSWGQRITTIKPISCQQNSVLEVTLRYEEGQLTATTG